MCGKLKQRIEKYEPGENLMKILDKLQSLLSKHDLKKESEVAEEYWINEIERLLNVNYDFKSKMFEIAESALAAINAAEYKESIEKLTENHRENYGALKILLRHILSHISCKSIPTEAMKVIDKVAYKDLQATLALGDLARRFPNIFNLTK